MVEYHSNIGGEKMPVRDIQRDDLDRVEGDVPESFDLDSASTVNGHQFGEVELDDGSYVIFTVTNEGEWVARQITTDDESVEEVLESIGSASRAEISDLIEEGLTPAEAIDCTYVELIERPDYSVSEWAERRGVSHQAVSENIRKAREKLGDE